MIEEYRITQRVFVIIQKIKHSQFSSLLEYLLINLTLKERVKVTQLIKNYVSDRENKNVLLLILSTHKVWIFV